LSQAGEGLLDDAPPEPPVELVEALGPDELVEGGDLGPDDPGVHLHEPVGGPGDHHDTRMDAGTGDPGGHRGHLDPDFAVAVEQVSLLFAELLDLAGLPAPELFVSIRERHDELVEAGDVAHDPDAHVTERSEGHAVVDVEPAPLARLGEAVRHVGLGHHEGGGQGAQDGGVLRGQLPPLAPGEVLVTAHDGFGPDDHVSGREAGGRRGHGRGLDQGVLGHQVPVARLGPAGVDDGHDHGQEGRDREGHQHALGHAISFSPRKCGVVGWINYASS